MLGRLRDTIYSVVQLFLDTNIYLDYFRSVSTDRLDPLRRLVKLVESKAIVLILPEQVLHEYQRERRKVAEETREVLLETSKQTPSAHLVLGKNKREVKAVTKAVKNTRQALDNLITKYDEQIEAEGTEADKLIKRLFNKSKKISGSEDIVTMAYSRYMKGNPPRKNNHSYGDAIVWEGLLKESTGESLTLISRDSDYTEKQKGKKALNTFLKSEWKQRTTHSINFFESLGEFINHFDKKETIRQEIVDKEKESFRFGNLHLNGVSTVNPARMESYGALSASSSGLINADAFSAFIPNYTSAWDSVYPWRNAVSTSIAYCPYCGTADPIPTNAWTFTLSGRMCKKCGKGISLN